MVCGVCHVAGGLGQLDARALAEAELRGVLIHLVDAQIMAYRVEEDVAGVLDSAGDIEIAVRELLIVLRVYPAVGRVAVLGVARVLAAALDGRAGAYYALGEGCDCSAGLEGRARSVGAQQCAVIQRRVCRFEYLVIVFKQLRRIVGRPVGYGQRLAGLDIYDNDRRTVYLILLFRIRSACYLLLLFRVYLRLYGGHAVFERKLGGLLKADVYRQIHVVAGLGLLGVFLADDRAVRGRGRAHRAVRAVQVFFKGELRAVLADIGVGGVALLGVFGIVAVAHRARVAEDVRRSRGRILADVGLLDVYALDIVLAQGRYELHVRVLDEDIVRGVYEIAHVHRVAHTGDYPRLLGGVVTVDLIAVSHAREHLDGAGVFGDVVLLHVSVKPRLILLGDVFVLKRRARRYRQIVDIIVAVIADHVDEL